MFGAVIEFACQTQSIRELYIIIIIRESVDESSPARQ
jgi:hypothetical protein